MEKKKRTVSRTRNCAYIFVSALQLTFIMLATAMDTILWVCKFLLQSILMCLFWTIGLMFIIEFHSFVTLTRSHDLLFVQSISTLTGLLMLLIGFKLGFDLFKDVFHLFDFLKIPERLSDAVTEGYTLEQILEGQTSLQKLVKGEDILKPGIGEFVDTSKLEDLEDEPQLDDMYYIEELSDTISGRLY